MTVGKPDIEPGRLENDGPRWLNQQVSAPVEALSGSRYALRTLNLPRIADRQAAEFAQK